MKFKLKKWVIVLVAIVAIIGLSMNLILNNVVSKIVHTQLEEINKKGVIKVELGDIKLNVFVGNLNLKNVSIKPDSLFFENFKQGLSEKASASAFNMSELKISGFSIYNLLANKEVSASKIVTKGLKLNLYKSSKHIEKQKDSKPKDENKTDSIFIKGINKIDFGIIVLENFELKIIEAHTADVLFEYSEEACEIIGINLDAHPSIENYFVFNKEGLKVNLTEQDLLIDEGNTKIIFNNIKYDYSTSSLFISNFSMQPTSDKAKLASTYKYNSEVYEFETGAIQIKGFHLDSILKTSIINIDSVLVDSPIIGIYKDQTKPFNESKRPKYLNQKLKAMDQPLKINEVFVTNGMFSYWEKHENFNELMTVEISDLNVHISNITSIKENFANGNPLAINLNGKLAKTAPINLEIYMDYNTWNDSYSFTGNVGKAQFTDFNPAIYPAAGVKFSNGTLKSIQFTVNGTPNGSEGKMSMLYQNLEADLSNTEKENKGLSWMANSVLVSSNPSNKGKLRIAEIEFERTPYKGFGNLLWKSVMSGMMNTLNPIGKTVKEEKHKKHHRGKK